MPETDHLAAAQDAFRRGEMERAGIAALIALAETADRIAWAAEQEMRQQTGEELELAAPAATFASVAAQARPLRREGRPCWAKRR
jgi:hypothetical protein